MRLNIIAIILLVKFSTLSAQCTVNNENGTCNGQCISSGIIGGQSFKVCDTGELEEISLTFIESGPNVQFVLRFYEGIGFSTPIWTTGVFTVTSTMPTIYDLSSGTGSNSVIVDNIYSFSIESVGTKLAFNIYECTAQDSYPDGTRLNCFGNPMSGQDARFRLAINGSALPVELTSFTGEVSTQSVILKWNTASELNNLGFEVQKSQNARDWKIIDFVEGRGTTNDLNKYQHKDSNPYSGINYYRLKQIDFDGAFEFSKIIAIEYNGKNEIIKVYPNPSNRIVNIQVDNPLSQRMEIRVVDNLGRTVWESGLIEDALSWSKEMEIKRNGIYFITAQIGNEILFERLLIMDEH